MCVFSFCFACVSVCVCVRTSSSSQLVKNGRAQRKSLLCRSLRLHGSRSPPASTHPASPPTNRLSAARRLKLHPPCRGCRSRNPNRKTPNSHNPLWLKTVQEKTPRILFCSSLLSSAQQLGSSLNGCGCHDTSEEDVPSGPEGERRAHTCGILGDDGC